MRRIGVLMPFAENDLDAQANITAFRQALQMLGWTDSRVRIDYRWGGGEPERAVFTFQEGRNAGCYRRLCFGSGKAHSS
jgi:hypothetical protein